MTEQPEIQQKILKLPESEPTLLLAEFSQRLQDARGINIPQSQEQTRATVTRTIVRTFAFVVCVFAAAAAYTSIWGDLERLEPIGKVALVISGAISPVVTFILGYYFATKQVE